MAEVTVTVTSAPSYTVTASNVTSGDNITFDPTVSNLTSTNLQNAIDELDHRFSQGTTPSSSGTYAQDGDLFYDTDDDELLVRRDGNWKELVIEATTGDIDGGVFT